MAGEDTKSDSSFQVTDKRFWVQDDSLVDRASVPERKFPSFVEELKGRTEAAEQKLRERLVELEEENAAFRERLNKQVEKRLVQEKADFLSGLLEIVDNFERAVESSASTSSLEAFLEGIRLNLSLLHSRLQAEGVEPVEVEGEEFDPEVAEAVGLVPVENAEDDHKVVEVLQRGYRYRDRILRPARVRVGQFVRD